MYPKARLDALTDGIFAVAMTILVLDLRIPDDVHPTDEASLVRALWSLWPKFFPYLLSFYLLGATWLSMVKVKSRGETVFRPYARWWLIYLVLVTCIPFTTLVMGRYTEFTAATTLYAANMAGLAGGGLRLMALSPDPLRDEHWLDRQVSLVILLISSLLTVALSFVIPTEALWAMLLNAGASPVVHWCQRYTGRTQKTHPTER